MKQILLRGGLPLLAMLSFTGCIDDNYDLSDIDTTSEFKVNNLVLPFNLDPVTLGDIIEIKEGEKIQEVTLNGQTFYAVRENGKFESDPINIPGFKAAAPSLSPSVLQFRVNGKSQNAPLRLPSTTLNLAEPVVKPFSFSASGIDASIIDLSDIFTDRLGISLNFDASDVSDFVDVELKDVVLTIPNGLTLIEEPEGYDYTSDNGRLEISSVKFDQSGYANVSLAASAIHLSEGNFDYSSHSLNLDYNVNIESAALEVTLKDESGFSLPDEVNINIDYQVSEIEVSAISGKIQYQLEGNALNISPISLSDIPDFLSGDGTNLVLANPQIYLKVNNPLADDKLNLQTGLQLTAIRDNEANKVFNLDNGSFEIGFNKGIEGPYNFCLSPAMPANAPEEYANFEHVGFSTLGNVIAGNGIPKSIDIKLIDPQVPAQNVTEFKLNDELMPMEGSWEFLAPLAMKEGSDAKIIYTDKVDGWGSDDLDKLTIEVLEINLKVTNDTPLAANLSGYPIDKKGNQISGVNIEGAVIPGGAKEAPVTIKITGKVTHLDGIQFTAVVTPDNGEALAPNQSITLSEIRAKVSGNYLTDF